MKHNSINAICLNTAKRCGCCDHSSPLGQYLPIPDNPLRQKWVCKNCINTSSSAIVLNGKNKGLIRQGLLTCVPSGMAQA